MLKTMKKTSAPQWGMDSKGNLIHPEMAIFKKKYTDFNAVKFPQVNPYDIRVPDIENDGK